MNKRKKWMLSGLLFLMLGLWGHSLVAQSRFVVKGEVLDSVTNKGVEYATVGIMDADSRAVASLVCDANGKFTGTLKAPGPYKVVVTSVGYASNQLTADVAASTTDLGKIYLTEGVQMEAVRVETTKPLIRSDVDKIAYSVESDPEAAVSNGLDILRKVPLVSVDGGDNVLVQGQSNFKVLLNGKSSSMMSNNFKEVIKSMPASSIKDIEVITNPSSRYEAEGVGGIINIITNRRNPGGYNGRIGLNTSSLGDVGGNGYFSAKLGKFTFSTNAFLSYINQPTITTDSYREAHLSDDKHYTNTSGAFYANGRYANLQLEASYEIDTFNLISLSMWGYNGRFNTLMDSKTILEDVNGQMSQGYANFRNGSTRYGGLSGNIDYQRTFMKPDKTFTVSYKLDSNPNKDNTESRIYEIMNYLSYNQLSVNDSYSREHTFQIDYNNPVTPKHNIEFGGKYILRQNDSNPEVYLQNSNVEWVPDPSRRNDLDYDQHIWGIYGGYTLKLKTWSFKAGARGEGTFNDGLHTSEKGETRFDNNQFNLVPYATVSYAKGAGRWSLSYTQRLQRPSIWYLNPYVDDVDPENISYGNPDLKTEITNRFNLSYGLFSARHSLSLTGFAAFTDNSIERYSQVNDNGVTISTYGNIGKRDNYGVNLYYSYRQGAKLTLSANLSGNYVRVDENGLNGVGNDGFTYNGYLNFRYGLWKNGAVMVNGGYFSPRINLQGESSSFYYYSLAVNHRAFKQKVTFSASIMNPFHRYRDSWSEIDTDTFYQRSNQRMEMRRVSLNVSYSFGKMNVQVKKARRGITNDDLKSGDGGGTVAGGASSGGQAN